MAPLDGQTPEQDQNDIIAMEDFIDPKGYWVDPERNIRRTSAEQKIILKATEACTIGEWTFLLESLGIEDTSK